MSEQDDIWRIFYHPIEDAAVYEAVLPQATRMAAEIAAKQAAADEDTRPVRSPEGA